MITVTWEKLMIIIINAYVTVCNNAIVVQRSCNEIERIMVELPQTKKNIKTEPGKKQTFISLIKK